jgi:hypothetical protein
MTLYKNLIDRRERLGNADISDNLQTCNDEFVAAINLIANVDEGLAALSQSIDAKLISTIDDN